MASRGGTGTQGKPLLNLLLEPWNKTREVQHGAYLDGAIHRATDKSVSIEV